jgi:hypothetical protein
MEDGGVKQEMCTPRTFSSLKTTLFNCHIQLQLEVVIYLGRGTEKCGKANVNQFPTTKTQGKRCESITFTNTGLQENM